MGLPAGRRNWTRHSVGRSMRGCLILPQVNPSTFEAMCVLRGSVVILLPSSNSRSEKRRPLNEISLSIDESRLGM